MLTLRNVTFDCENPVRVAAFWGAALSYDVVEHNTHFAEVRHPDGIRPKLQFIKVPEKRTVKNRVHLSVTADDREAEVTRLVGLGATRGETHRMPEYGITWTVLQDPEGNELCVGQDGEE